LQSNNDESRDDKDDTIDTIEEIEPGKSKTSDTVVGKHIVKQRHTYSFFQSQLSSAL
jgi:hypothetical protein